MEKYFTEIIVALTTILLGSGISGLLYMRSALDKMKEQIKQLQEQNIEKGRDIKELEVENRQLITGVAKLETKIDNLERMVGEMRVMLERVLTRTN